MNVKGLPYHGFGIYEYVTYVSTWSLWVYADGCTKDLRSSGGIYSQLQFEDEAHGVYCLRAVHGLQTISCQACRRCLESWQSGKYHGLRTKGHVEWPFLCSGTMSQQMNCYRRGGWDEQKAQSWFPKSSSRCDQPPPLRDRMHIRNRHSTWIAPRPQGR